MKKLILILTSLFIVNSCESVTYKTPKDCSTIEQNRFVYEYMKENYLWYSQLPKVDYSSYSSPEKLLEALKNPKDHWSFIIEKKALDDYFSGKGYVGYGFKLKKEDKIIITMVYPGSPASRAGLRRGDKILKINNQDVSAMSIQDINQAMGEDKQGVTTTFDIERIGSVTLTKEQVEIASVLQKEILDIDGEKVGYLMFDTFIETSTNELKDAFSVFEGNNISKLIIDMRYNGGGLVGVANDLVSLIIGKGNSGDISMSLKFNDKNSNKNSSYYIKEYSQSMNLEEVYFITTKNTCSSSEAVINALKPYGVDVKLVGSTTCGKPVGMAGGEFCSKYILPIEFKIVNSDGYGDYFGGIGVDCAASDDIYHDFGDIQEAMLNETIYLLRNGVCSSNQRVLSKNINITEHSQLKGFRAITGGAY